MSKGLGFVAVTILVCGASVGEQSKPTAVGTGGLTNKTPAASRVTFGSNLHTDPCWPCQYNPAPSGFVVWGPNNCSSPGDVQRVAIAFIAQASGTAERIYASIVLHNATSCPTNQVTLSLYTDACYPDGVGTLLASGVATVPAEPCGLAVATLQSPPALTAGVKYWVTATTGPGQDALDAQWHSTNDAQLAYNFGDAWNQGIGNTPGFTVEGSGSTQRNFQTIARRTFASNLVVDPCNGCLRDEYIGGYYVQGPKSCGVNSMVWIGASFIATATGVPERLVASMNLNNSDFCKEDIVILSLYTDNCGTGPATLLVSGKAKIPPMAECGLAVAKLKNSHRLRTGEKYWITGTTNAAQATLNATWNLSNTTQIALDIGEGWFESNVGPPAFAVQ